MRVIAFGHKARQGKTWSAHWLAGKLPGKTFVWGFGDGLKAVARGVYGMGSVKDPALLQSLAEEYRRIEPGIWIRVWEGTIADQEGTYDTILVPDLRHTNEALFLKERFEATLVKVARVDPETGEPWISPDRSSTHVSEIDLDSWPLWDVELAASSTEELGLGLHEAFLEGRTQPPGKKTFHHHWRFVPGQW